MNKIDGAEGRTMIPEFITAMKTFTYSTSVIRDLNPDWTDEEIMLYIEDLAHEDLGGGFILVDEDGNEL